MGHLGNSKKNMEIQAGPPPPPSPIQASNHITFHLSRTFDSFPSTAQNWAALFKLALKSLHIWAPWALPALLLLPQTPTKRATSRAVFLAAPFAQNPLPLQAESPLKATVSMTAFPVHSADNSLSLGPLTQCCPEPRCPGP